jgi:transposase
VAAKPADNAAITRRDATPPHNHARHICRDMWRATYPYSGALYIFRGRRGDLVKILFWDRQGMCLYAKKLDRGRFIWPQAKEGIVSLTMAQLSNASGIDRLARHGVDGKARGRRLIAAFCIATRSGLVRVSRIE